MSLGDAAQMTEKIATVLAGREPSLPARAGEALARWLELVAVWNAKVDLTAARNPDELADLMLADARLLSEHVPEGRRVVDVGTGAGAPGLPLALLRPDLDVTLVEPLQKRVAFLRTALGTLVQQGVLPRAPRVERARGEDLVRAGRSFDVAISRATLAPDAWLPLGAALTERAPADRREVWVLLARDEPPAHAGWAPAIDLRYRWPLTGAERRAVRYLPDHHDRLTAA
ncbi:16S rRNA (guanine(527)-N(7))-methyltransferase RsmG [Sorangium sp. So ce406]|uniref:16S rRNA (guanine(527)-N(7))-methyltransferase RsmG n=1 Tax=Sorangium sp. So ce406 TaxID=3133311 RepID=UPI003F5B8D81